MIDIRVVLMTKLDFKNLVSSLFHKLTFKAFLVDYAGNSQKDDSPKFIPK